MIRASNAGPMTLDGTNTWLLRAPGASRALAVDPGPLDDHHLRAVAAHAPLAGILVTHGHPDHVAGVSRLAELTGAPVLDLDEAETLAEAGLSVRMLRTPGHTGDSVSYVVNDSVVLSGDTILGRGTTVVAWPDGDLGDYFVSLERLTELGELPVLPGHGPPLTGCASAARYYRAHREARLAQVRAVLHRGDADASDAAGVVRMVYADVDQVLWPAAEATVRAQLAYLEERA